jgi:sugar lactone lactonase YvrE
MRILRAGIALVVVVLVLWLGLRFAPGIEPVSWDPPAVAPPSPVTAPNERLKAIEWWGKQLVGPEAITLDSEGRLVTGLKDGRVVRLMPGSEQVELLADTRGRPLAVAFHPDGRLIICDAHAGLLALDGKGTLETLATEEGGVKFALADDLDIARDGTIYFTDASSRNSLERFTEDLLEHQTSGRLLKYDMPSRKVTKLADGFSFINGVALGPDEQYVIVSETGMYRLWRVWLTGPKAGQKELFTDSLPGFPDNVRYSKARHVFWVAIGSPRKPEIDSLAHLPLLRKLITYLPPNLRPAPARHAYVLAVDEAGKPVESLQYDAPDSYSPVACATESADGWLYLGSFAREGVARVKLPPPP